MSTALPGRRLAAASAFLYARCGSAARLRRPPMLCICCARKTRPDISACQSGFPLGSLRSTFSNLTPRTKTLVTRWKRGVYRVSQRLENTPIQDVRGACVRRIGKPQTFLTTAEVDRLVDDYLAGLSVGYLAQKYGVHRATVSKHLTRNHVVLERSRRVRPRFFSRSLPIAGPKRSRYRLDCASEHSKSPTIASTSIFHDT